MQTVTATASLVEELDKKLLVVLRDGRKLVGTLRSYDQFANVVLENTVERIFVDNEYCERPLGLFVIRGENVTLLGEIDLEKEIQVQEDKLQLVPYDMLIQSYKKEKEKQEEQSKLKRKLLSNRGIMDEIDDSRIV